MFVETFEYNLECVKWYVRKMIVSVVIFLIICSSNIWYMRDMTVIIISFTFLLLLFCYYVHTKKKKVNKNELMEMMKKRNKTNNV